ETQQASSSDARWISRSAAPARRMSERERLESTCAKTLTASSRGTVRGGGELRSSARAASKLTAATSGHFVVGALPAKDLMISLASCDPRLRASVAHVAVSSCER